MSRTDRADFESLIAPCTPETFFSKHWRRQLLYSPATDASAFDALFGLDDLDPLFNAAAHNPGDWFFFRASADVDRNSFTDSSGQIQLNQIHALYRDGGTIHLRNTQRYLPGIERFWRSLSLRFRTQVRINAWVTRGNDFTPYLHYDTHDIFVVQIHGSKQWTMYERNSALFAPRAGNVDIQRGDVGTASHQITVKRGDVLYVPAGTPHEVVTTEPHSIHLAVSIFPLLWRDLLDVALSEIDRHGGTLTDAVEPELLVESHIDALCAALRERLAGAVSEIDRTSLHEKLQARFVETLSPPRDSHFLREVLRAEDVTASTFLRRRGAGPAVVEVDDAAELARIRFGGGGAMEGPAALAPLLRAISCAEGPFCAEQLHSDYDLSSRALVLSELLQRGLLERVTPV